MKSHPSSFRRRTESPSGAMAYVARRFISLIVLASAAVAGVAALASEALGFSADFAKATAIVVFALVIALGSSLGFRLESRGRGQ